MDEIAQEYQVAEYLIWGHHEILDPFEKVRKTLDCLTGKMHMLKDHTNIHNFRLRICNIEGKEEGHEGEDIWIAMRRAGKRPKKDNPRSTKRTRRLKC